MDIADTIAPKSDQQNYDDYLSGPKTVTVSEVRVFEREEQPVEIHLAEFPERPFRPSKTMRRALVIAWGKKGSEYAGRRMTLYGDPAVRYGGAPVGGIKISHLSHIDKPLRLSLTETRGKKALHTIQPLTEAPARDWIAEADAITDVDALRALHAAATRARASADTLAHIVARGHALAAAPVAAHDEEATA